MPATLAEVLAPLSTDDFLHNYLGQQFFLGKGQPGKFSGLLPWSDVNRILRQHRLDVPRLRVVQDGRPIPAESFLTYRAGKSSRIARIRPVELTAKLRDGATLIIDSVDELQEPVTRLSENFEQVLRARIQVNMYAGWRTSRGFDLHWDDHDVIVLQIAGRKHWKVYPMTREYPLAGDSKAPANAPQSPLWEGLLEEGDYLYIPRGWWHVAVPLDEPTLHLTCGVHRPSGVDLLAWFTERLHNSVAVRQDLPRFATPAAQAAHLERIRQAIGEAWSPDLISAFLAETDARTKPRPHFSLPSILTLPTHGQWHVKWIAPRPVEFQTNQPGKVTFTFNGKQWTFAAAAAPLLELLQAQSRCSLDQLQSASGTLSSAAVRAFVKELLDSGLAALDQ